MDENGTGTEVIKYKEQQREERVTRDGYERIEGIKFI